MSAKPMRGVLVGALLVVGLVLVGTLAQAFPEPAVVTKAWELDFTYSPPRALAIKGADGKVQWYWYLPYKIVNNTGSERVFIPEVTIATDEGDILTAGKNVPTHVFTAIKKNLGRALLESPTEIVGKVLQGEDNARESVAIWPALNHDVNHLTIFFAGISGETQSVELPGLKDPVLVAKTLMLDYESPGRTTNPQEVTLNPKGKAWVMR